MGRVEEKYISGWVEAKYISGQVEVEFISRRVDVRCFWTGRIFLDARTFPQRHRSVSLCMVERAFEQ